MDKNKLSYEEFWKLIQKNEGLTIYTKTGIPFSYHIRTNSILVDGTDWLLGPKMLRYAMTYGLLMGQVDSVTELFNDLPMSREFSMRLRKIKKIRELFGKLFRVLIKIFNKYEMICRDI